MKEIFTILLIASSWVSFSQSHENQCEDLKTLNTQLQKDNAYFREALDLRQSKKRVEIDKRVIVVHEVVYKNDKKELWVSGLVENNNEKYSNIYFRGASFVDPQGGFSKTFNVFHPSGEAFVVLSSTTEIPYGFTYVFKNVAKPIPTLSLLQINLATDNLRNDEFKFIGVEVK